MPTEDPPWPRFLRSATPQRWCPPEPSTAPGVPGQALAFGDRIAALALLFGTGFGAMSETGLMPLGVAERD